MVLIPPETWQRIHRHEYQLENRFPSTSLFPYLWLIVLQAEVPHVLGHLRPTCLTLQKGKLKLICAKQLAECNTGSREDGTKKIQIKSNLITQLSSTCYNMLSQSITLEEIVPYCSKMDSFLCRNKYKETVKCTRSGTSETIRTPDSSVSLIC